MNFLISIIIPTYNRYHLIGATLDSVIKQTYQNWECIVVDDGSGDYTPELLQLYCDKDVRIKYYKRPNDVRKGANACRNYGFKVSRGEFIQWFDSDDLMDFQSLEIKKKALEDDNVDFVIAKSLNFRDPDPENIISANEAYYKFDLFEISNINYISQKINWLTYDFMGKRKLCNKTSFNERLNSSQEYNYFCKLTCFSTDAIIINKYLTKRRIHSKSIRATLNLSDENIILNERKYIKLQTWKDIAEISPGSDSEKYFLFPLLKTGTMELPDWRVQHTIIFHCFKQKRHSMWIFLLFYLYLYKMTGQGYFLRNLFFESIDKRL